MSRLEETAKHPWIENIEGLALAVIMALTLKYFVIEAYKIPTGSMQPVLMGLDQPGMQIFDRILVDKLAYLTREPQRWEVIVFKYPLDQSKNYIKRLIGMPGDTLRIEGGNLYLRNRGDEFQVLRKPAKVQADLWKEVYHSGDTGQEVRSEADFWVQEFGNWNLENGSIQALGAGKLRFRKTIRDVYADGYPQAIQSIITQTQRESGMNTVGDLRIGFQVLANADCRSVRASLGNGDRIYQLTLSGPAGDGTSKITVGEETLETLPLKLQSTRPTRVRFAHVDESLVLELDGKKVFHHEFPGATDRRFNVASNLVSLETAGGGASFLDVQIDRDQHYTQAGGKNEWQVPPGKYFFLGDNTQNSYDGRLWIKKTCSVLGKDGSIKELQGDGGSADVNPRLITVERGEHIYAFTDWFGEVHRFPERAIQGTSQVDYPFVPRDFLMGKAIFVFWPVPPFAPIPRWKLIY